MIDTTLWYLCNYSNCILHFLFGVKNNHLMKKQACQTLYRCMLCTLCVIEKVHDNVLFQAMESCHQELKKEIKAEAMVGEDHENYAEKLKRVMVRVTGKHM